MNKTCTICKESKDPSCFFGHKDTSDKLRPDCKTCASLRNKQNRLKPQSRYTEYRYAATARGHDFNLTYEEFMTFWQQPCSYCGDGIETIGVDRVNSHIGYELSNCVACCKICNIMKLNLSQEQWFRQMNKILNYTGGIS
jgi:hypothetical protein